MMLIAGLSEFYLIAALILASLYAPKNTPKNIQIGYLFALFITALAALSGALKYLDILDTNSWHHVFSYASKHLAMAVFVICALWPLLKNLRQKQLAFYLLLLSLFSFLINLSLDLAFTADIVIISSIFFAFSLLKADKTARFKLLAALSILLSTLLWGAIIDNNSLRIGIFHLCLGSYFLLLAHTLSAYHLNHRGNTST